MFERVSQPQREPQKALPPDGPELGVPLRCPFVGLAPATSRTIPRAASRDVRSVRTEYVESRDLILAGRLRLRRSVISLKSSPNRLTTSDPGLTLSSPNQ